MFQLVVKNIDALVVTRPQACARMQLKDVVLMKRPPTTYIAQTLIVGAVGLMLVGNWTSRNAGAEAMQAGPAAPGQLHDKVKPKSFRAMFVVEGTGAHCLVRFDQDSQLRAARWCRSLIPGLTGATRWRWAGDDLVLAADGGQAILTLRADGQDRWRFSAPGKRSIVALRMIGETQAQ
jgi:hypothetical protein